MSSITHHRAAHTTVQQPSPAPILDTDTDTEHYESAKGCFMLSLFIIGSLAVCTVVGYGIHAYIEYSVG